MTKYKELGEQTGAKCGGKKTWKRPYTLKSWLNLKGLKGSSACASGMYVGADV